jgi:hypothetical protein
LALRRRSQEGKGDGGGEKRVKGVWRGRAGGMGKGGMGLAGRKLILGYSREKRAEGN